MRLLWAFAGHLPAGPCWEIHKSFLGLLGDRDMYCSEELLFSLGTIHYPFWEQHPDFIWGNSPPPVNGCGAGGAAEPLPQEGGLPTNLTDHPPDNSNCSRVGMRLKTVRLQTGLLRKLFGMR